MQFINVPFSDKDKAKQLGAKWNATRKSWYIPDGVPITAFERWLPKSDGSEPAKTVKSTPGKQSDGASPTVAAPPKWPTHAGSKFFKIDHSCIPWETCEICAKDERVLAWRQH